MATKNPHSIKDHRLAAVREALSTHAMRSGGEGPRSDKSAATIDLLTNLRHYAKHHDLDLDDLIKISMYHFDAENKM